MRIRLRVVRVFVLAALACALAQCPGFPWGDEGHRRITTVAIGVLPTDLKLFYSKNAGLVVTLSPLPDDWKQYRKPGEDPNHYINFEDLGSLPFANVRVSLQTAKAKFGAAKLKEAGYLPWTIIARYNKLVKTFNWCIASFKQKDSVLDADESAAQAYGNGSAQYYQQMWTDTGPILQGRLTNAAQAVAGVYVAAWTEAGKPKLYGKRAPVYWSK